MSVQLSKKDRNRLKELTIKMNIALDIIIKDSSELQSILSKMDDRQ